MKTSMILKSSVLSFAMVFGGGVFVGCDSPAENAAEDVSDAAEDTADAAGDAVDDAADDVEEAAE